YARIRGFKRLSHTAQSRRVIPHMTEHNVAIKASDSATTYRARCPPWAMLVIMIYVRAPDCFKVVAAEVAASLLGLPQSRPVLRLHAMYQPKIGDSVLLSFQIGVASTCPFSPLRANPVSVAFDPFVIISALAFSLFRRHLREVAP